MSIDLGVTVQQFKAGSRAFEEKFDSVCRIILPPNTEGFPNFGTGFLIGKNLLLTNYHVLRNADTVRRSTASFFNEQGKQPLNVEFNFFEGEQPFFSFSPSVKPNNKGEYFWFIRKIGA